MPEGAIPESSDVVANVIANLIVSATAWAVRATYELPFESDDTDAVVGEAISSAVRDSLVSLADVEEIDDVLGAERFRAFLQSPDAHNFVQRLFFAVLLARSESIPLLMREFTATWAAWTGQTADNLARHGARVFDVIERAVRAAVAELDESGSTERDHTHQLLALVNEQLASIDRRIAFLTGGGVTAADVATFERLYRQQVAQRHSRITPPHIDDARRVPLANIYVEPHFTVRSAEHAKRKRLDLATVRSGIRRTVVLGQPGGGKSTFTLKLCADLTSRYEEGLVGGIPLTPILVVLREYGIAKAERQTSLVEFVEESARSSYLVTPPVGVVEYMLQQGRALVIFDGLDELVDPSRRRAVRDDIESFCNRYPAVRTLVTAREIGYEQAPLDSGEFTVFSLVEFDDDQVASYVTKWFHAHPEVTLAQRDRQINAFLHESAAVVRDLRRNALLLALMCNIYKGEGYIPTNRPEVYEKCSNMLLRRWDGSRGIEVKRPLGAHLERTLQHIAHWVFHNVDLQSGVPERRLVDVATHYLADKRFEDIDEARAEAVNFLEFCKGRAWVLVEVGTSNQQPLFQFAHRTFLEYFTADYLVRTSGSPTALGRSLLPKMGRASWDVVAQLAFQIQHAYREDAGDELLRLTLDSAASAADDDFAKQLSFALRALEFLVPTPPVTRQIGEAGYNGLARLADIASARPSRRKLMFVQDAAFRLIEALLSPSEDNVKVLSASVAERVRADLTSENPTAAARAAYLLLLFAEESLPARGSYAFARWATDLHAREKKRVHDLARDSPPLAMRLLYHRSIGPESVVETFGAAPLFDPPLDQFGGLFSSSWSATRLIIASDPDFDVPDLEAELAAVGEALLHAPLPWLRGRAAQRRASTHVARRTRTRDQTRPLSGDAAFGAFCLTLPLMQSSLSAERLMQASGHGDGSLARLVQLGMGRLRKAPTQEVRAVADAFHWSDEQRRFAEDWLTRRVSVVGRESSDA